MDEKIKEGWSDWINVGKLIDFQAGKRKILIYANTIDLVWHIGVIINGGEDG